MQTLASEIAPESRPFEPGDRVGEKFVIRRRLGSGAMGNVYLAEHQLLSRPVALKVLHSEFCENATILQRFIDEARMLAILRSEHTVRVVDAEVNGKQAFIAMEYVDGTHLGEFLRSEKHAETATLLDLARQIALGLAEAHAHGIVHRDIKPENVLLTRQESGRLIAKVADFGVAKRLHLSAPSQRTQNGALLGTPSYMAPEQIHSPSKVDQRADVFSLGVLIYQMCTGYMPFGGKRMDDIAHSVMTVRPFPLKELNEDIPPEVSDLVDACLEKDPDQRHISALDVAERLARVLASLDPDTVPGSARENSARENLDTPTAAVISVHERSRRGGSAWTLGLCAIAAFGAMMTLYGSPDAQNEALALGNQAAERLNLALRKDALETAQLTSTPRAVQAWSLPSPEPAVAAPDVFLDPEDPTIQVATSTQFRPTLAAHAGRSSMDPSSMAPPKVARLQEDPALSAEPLPMAALEDGLSVP